MKKNKNGWKPVGKFRTKCNIIKLLNSDKIYHIHVLIEQNEDGTAILKRQLFDQYRQYFKQQIESLKDLEGNTFSFLNHQVEIKQYLDELGFEYIGEKIFYNFDMNEQQKRLVFKRHFKLTEEKLIPVHYKNKAT